MSQLRAAMPARLIFALGVAIIAAAIALTARTYMACPFWDEWAFVNAIANGEGITKWRWLWSQHNEHRLLLTRLLILADLHWFGGKNVSLFVEMYLAQLAAWGAICHALWHYTTFPRALRFSIAGLFAFCLFHFNQSQNFTWAFQTSFVIAFAVGTLALLGVAYFERWRWPLLAAIGIGMTPLIASVNVAGGLMIGPVLIVFAMLRRLSWRYVIVMAVLFMLSAGAYLTNYRVPASRLTPGQALGHPLDLLVYVLTYFGASWTHVLPHKERVTCLLSFVALGIVVTRLVRRRRLATSFEWFCVATCAAMMLVAFVTALGRLQYGVGQAFASRYQTPAMYYWAALCALVLVTVWREWPMKFVALAWGLALVLIANGAACLPVWRMEVARNDRLARACDAALHGNRDEAGAKLLYGGTTRDLEPGVEYLRRVWKWRDNNGGAGQ